MLWGVSDASRQFLKTENLRSLVPAKTRRHHEKRVVIPIHATLYRMLERVPSKLRKGYLLPETAALYKRDPAALSKRISNVRWRRPVDRLPGLHRPPRPLRCEGDSPVRIPADAGCSAKEFVVTIQEQLERRVGDVVRRAIAGLPSDLLQKSSCRKTFRLISFDF